MKTTLLLSLMLLCACRASTHPTQRSPLGVARSTEQLLASLSQPGPIELETIASGWEHEVEPGTFSGDLPTSATSFKQLKAFAAAHPQIEVRLGHQK